MRFSAEKLHFYFLPGNFAKSLDNGLSNAPGLNVSKEKIKEVLARMELSETVRGETLTLEQFAQLADLLRG